MSRQSALPPLCTTGIGSLPHTSLELALQQALSVDLPYVPSMPARSAAEYMIPQVVEGLPGARFDREGNTTIALDAWKAGAPALAAALDRALQKGELEPFEPSAEAYSAWKPFLWEIESRKLRHAKAQLTGPVTARWAVALDDGRPASAVAELDRQLFRLALARALAMTRAIRERGATPVFFLDEPGLYAFDRKNPAHLMVLQELKLYVLALKKEGALVGLHCCSNTDWAFLFGLGLDIVALDARLSLGAALAAGAAFEQFLAGGGRLALGIVPTNLAASYDLPALVEAVLAMLRAHGGAAAVSRALSGALLTPACGLALRTVPDTERIFEDLARARALLRAALP